MENETVNIENFSKEESNKMINFIKLKESKAKHLSVNGSIPYRVITYISSYIRDVLQICRNGLLNNTSDLKSSPCSNIDLLVVRDSSRSELRNMVGK